MADNPLKKVGGFVANEMLGIDDFGRVFTKAMEGDVSGALKSAGAGALELGSTLFTGGAGTVAKQGAKAGIKAAIKQGAKESVEAGVKAGVKAPKFGSAPGPSDLIGSQFKPKAGTITKPKPAPTKPGDLPGAPGYPRTPAKPGDLPGAPGYPKPKPLPTPKPVPKPTPKPTTKPAPKPATKPSVKPSTKPTTKPKSEVETKPSTGPQWKNLPKALPAAGLGVGAAMLGGALLRGNKDKKEEGPWNPSAIV